MGKLILIRHGQSLWNEKGLWTGWTDIGLSEKGFTEARQAGEAIKDIPLAKVFTSSLLRAKQTWLEIAKSTGNKPIEVVESQALNERNYGDYTGKNKWDLKDQFGEVTFQKIRRGFRTPIPNGETLEDVYNRVVPYFKNTILPYLKNNQNILISAHGNSLRALVKFLESLSDEAVEKLEIQTGEVYMYTIDDQGKVQEKTILSKDLQNT